LRYIPPTAFGNRKFGIQKQGPIINIITTSSYLHAA
jgi:hypothetical protein